MKSNNIRKRHFQHKKEFIAEVRSVNAQLKIQEPFFTTTGVMKIGKHKGSNIKELLKDYIQWMVATMNLNSLHKRMLLDLT